MHIVAIAWLYVTLLMAMTESNVTAGLLNWVLFGLVPLAGLFWITVKLRRRRPGGHRSTSAAQLANPPPPIDRSSDNTTRL